VTGLEHDATTAELPPPYVHQSFSDSEITKPNNNFTKAIDTTALL